MASTSTGAAAALGKMTEAALLDRIPVNSQIRVPPFRVSCKVSSLPQMGLVYGLSA